MKLDGVMSFSALFTVVNEYEQIRYQAFVPTKSLSHIWSGLEAMVKSLSDHGHALPVLGFTDNVAGDAGIFLECIPSLGKDVKPVELNEFEDLPRLTLPSDVMPVVCNTEPEIDSVCLDILGLLNDGNSKLHVGFDMEWEFNIESGSFGSQKTALVQIALPKVVYLLRVFTLKKLPSSLQTILKSLQILKIGHNVGGDLAKLACDFQDFDYHPGTHKKGIIELGHLASEKNAVSSGKASLAEITAATLQQSLSKEVWTSE
jgi:3'-5' exonuclease